ncbi:spondin domain-containing protein [Ghiorsea bivora]|uniref:spondin domain-containing protein n=1 Tax=Ghiorsea bivora TaxID=1485545 RepID=UPI00057143E2|nr:spondin domain-containing protein [Ghiorsea bivora]
MKKHITLAGMALGLLISQSAFAQNFTVAVTNLTNGIYFTPLLVTAAPSTTHLYTPGMAASANLQAMAEGGDTAGLTTDLMAVGADIAAANATPMAPGATATATFTNTAAANTHLSVVGMLLPTNDGFVGLDSIMVPTAAGTYTFFANAYDAGTEANNELIVAGSGAPNTLGIPADPGAANGTGGTGVAAVDANTTVHIHRGIIGDTNPTAGISDLDTTVHRWLNPVAQIVVTVQ